MGSKHTVSYIKIKMLEAHCYSWVAFEDLGQRIEILKAFE